MIKWDEEIETEMGHEAKLIDPCFIVDGLPYKLVKVPAQKEGGTDRTVCCREDGSFVHASNDRGNRIRNKPKAVTKWIILWKEFPGVRYFDTADAARESVRLTGRNDFIKITKVEWVE